MLFLACFGVYLATLNPAFPNDDSAETITAGVTLGLQHPPGYALAALLGRIGNFLPLGVPSLRAGVLSSFLAASVVCLLALNLCLILKLVFEKAQPPGLVLFCAVIPSLIFAFSPTVWRNALGAKGDIYLLAALLQLAILACLLRRQASFPSSNTHRLDLVFFLLGLGFANHWETQAVLVPGLLLFIFWNPGQGFQAPAFLSTVKILVFILLGASPLLYLPLRAHLRPFLNLGAPDTWGNFVADLSRHYVADREVGLLGTLGHLLTGASTWGQFSDLLRTILRMQGLPLLHHLLDDMGLLALMLAVLGFVFWFRTQERKILSFTALFLACLVGALLSTLILTGDSGQSWILDNFLLPSNWVIASGCAVGMFFLLSRMKLSSSRIAPLSFLALGLVPFALAYGGFETISQERQTLAYDYGENLLKSLPRNSVFFAEGDEDYFSLYYLQAVLGQRMDVRMIPAFTLFETWGVAQTEKNYPELGLTADPLSFPDHFTRIERASTEIVDKNLGRRPVAFSYFNGAFHRYYLSRDPSRMFRKSGIVLEMDSPLLKKSAYLPLTGLRLRHTKGGPSNSQSALYGIMWVYLDAGAIH